MDPLYAQKTTHPSSNVSKPNWVLIDAKDQILGRVCTEVVTRLQGKHLPNYRPGVLMGDSVVIVNAEHVKITGKKLDQKNYYRHTGYLGGIKSRTIREQMNLAPEKVFMNTLKGMLPKTKLGNKLLTRVRIFSDEKHSLEAQNPQKLEINTKG